MKWTPEKYEQLRRLALAGKVKGEIAAEMGATVWAVSERARQMRIRLALHTPAQKAVFAERAKQRDHLRNERKAAANRKKRVEGRKAAAVAAGHSVAVAPRLTKLELRRVHAIPGTMSKSQQRAFLADAVRNTAQMQAVDQ